MNTGAIFGKELRVLVNSPSTWWVAMVNLLLTGYFFAALLFASSQMGQFDTQGMLGTLVWLPLAFTTPAYSMRLFSEEARLHTEELLFTSPATSMGIVLGKWMAASLALMLPLFAASGAYAYILVGMAKVNMAGVGLMFLGLMLAALLYMAIGVFTSTLSNSSPVCLLLHLAVNVSLLLLGLLAAGTEESLSGSIAKAFSLMDHLEAFGEGAVELVDVGYFVLFSAALLFVSARRIDQRRMI